MATSSFTGGVGIADQWEGDAQNDEHWRDSHYRIEGPAVAQMQAAFMENWIKATGTVLRGEAYFPALSPRGTLAGQVFTSSPSGGADSMLLMYLLAFSSSGADHRSIGVVLVPDELTQRVLVDALKRGVRCGSSCLARTSTPRSCVRLHAPRGGRLLAAGAQIYEYQPTMFIARR